MLFYALKSPIILPLISTSTSTIVLFSSFRFMKPHKHRRNLLFSHSAFCEMKHKKRKFTSDRIPKNKIEQKKNYSCEIITLVSYRNQDEEKKTSQKIFSSILAPYLIILITHLSYFLFPFAFPLLFVQFCSFALCIWLLYETDFQENR